MSIFMQMANLICQHCHFRSAVSDFSLTSMLSSDVNRVTKIDTFLKFKYYINNINDHVLRN